MGRIGILTVGDELVEGRLVDSNAAAISDELTRAGLTVVRHVSVPDAEEEIAEAVHSVGRHCDALLVTGGLGPTDDDLTSAALARATGREVLRFPEAVAHLESFFASRGRAMSASNLKQADLPRGASIIPNPKGTAVGFSLDGPGCRLYAMPGVPAEMSTMLRDHVAPELVTTLPCQRPSISTLKSFGLPESEVGQRLQDLPGTIEPPARLWIQYRATFPEIHVRLVLHDGDAQMLEEAASEARSRLGRHVFAHGEAAPETSFADTVAAALNGANATLGLADSFTAGQAAGLLMKSEHGASCLRGGLICPTDAGLVKLLDLPRDQAPVEAARLAAAAACYLEASHGVAIVAGTGSRSTDGRGDGFCLAISCADGKQAERTVHLPFDLPRLRTVAAYAALDIVKQQLLDQSLQTPFQAAALRSRA